MGIEVDQDACRQRQRRLLQVMEQEGWEWSILTSIENVQWLTGARSAWTFAPAAALHQSGRVVLVFPHKEPPAAAADEIVIYTAKRHSTMRNDQRQASTEQLLATIGGELSGSQVAVEYSTAGGYLLQACSAMPADLEPQMYHLRRRKDADELARLRVAIRGTARMYEVAREIIRPGVSEIEVFNALQTAAVEEFDEMLTGTGNDYQVNSRGGPPRGGQRAAAGQLYILDLGPAFRGYFADNARTIAVSDVSDAQQTAWEHIMRVFQHVEERVRPGVSCKQVFEEAQAILDECPVGVFNHHLGHGIGLFPHEGPHLNPHWDDTFEVGDVFTAEPGLYAPELQSGMRIENDYLVTEDGIECLTHFPLELQL